MHSELLRLVLAACWVYLAGAGAGAVEVSMGVITASQHLQNVGTRPTDTITITDCSTAIVTTIAEATGLKMTDIELYNISWHASSSQMMRIVNTQYRMSATSDEGYDGLQNEFDRIESAITKFVHTHEFTKKLRDYATRLSCDAFSEVFSYTAPTISSEEIAEVHTVPPTSSPTDFHDPSQHLPFLTSSGTGGPGSQLSDELVTVTAILGLLICALFTALYYKYYRKYVHTATHRDEDAYSGLLDGRPVPPEKSYSDLYNESLRKAKKAKKNNTSNRETQNAQRESKSDEVSKKSSFSKYSSESKSLVDISGFGSHNSSFMLSRQGSAHDATGSPWTDANASDTAGVEIRALTESEARV